LIKLCQTIAGVLFSGGLRPSRRYCCYGNRAGGSRPS